jgi:hypothetical protein
MTRTGLRPAPLRPFEMEPVTTAALRCGRGDWWKHAGIANSPGMPLLL